MEKKQNVPELRFQGFSGEWERKTLEEMGSSFSYGLNAAATTYDGQHKYLRITDIDDESRKFSDKDLTSPNVDLSNISDYKLQENDIVFARTGASVGKTYLYDTSDGDVYYAGFLIRVKIDSKYDANFIFQKTLSSDYSHFVVVTSQRSGQPGINAQEYAALEMLVPELGEQKNIGGFFTDFDKNIFVCRKKIQTLQQFRQAMLAKIFPREGAAEPELRFRGFSGAWRENKIADIAGSTYGGGTPSTLCREFWQGNIPWIQSSDILLDDIWRVVPHKHISKNALKKSNIRIIPKNSIAIVIRVGVGKLAFIPFSYTTSQDFLSLGNLCIDSAFAICAIKKKMEEDILIVQGTSIKGVTKNEILNKTIMIPQSVLEQQKIGNFFKGLDSFISLQQKRLERMQRLKAALLEKMFV